MGERMDEVKDRDTVLSEAKMLELRKAVFKRREELFRKNWKNRRPVLPLRSLHQEKSFKFVVEWYEEFDEVVGRERERNRLDKLIEKGLDVNAPENKKQ
jgi:hypothetical protein